MRNFCELGSCGVFVALREIETKAKLPPSGLSLLLEQVCPFWALLISLSLLFFDFVFSPLLQVIPATAKTHTCPPACGLSDRI